MTSKLTEADPAFYQIGLIKISNVPLITQSRNRLHALLVDTASDRYGTIAFLNVTGSTALMSYFIQAYNEDAISELDGLWFEGNKLHFEPCFTVNACPISQEEIRILQCRTKCKVVIPNRRNLETEQSKQYQATRHQANSSTHTWAVTIEPYQ